MATGFDQFCPRAKSLEQCLSGIRAAPYVGCPGGIDGDRGDVDKLGQPTLEVGTVTRGERLIVRARGRGDGHRNKGNGDGASVRLGAQSQALMWTAARALLAQSQRDRRADCSADQRRDVDEMVIAMGVTAASSRSALALNLKHLCGLPRGP